MPAVHAYIREELARLETVAKEMADDRTPENGDRLQKAIEEPGHAY